jgi:hypothetical protein
VQVRKDFGKQKMYFPDQKGLAALSTEECAAKQAALQQSQAACREQEDAVTALRRGESFKHRSDGDREKRERERARICQHPSEQLTITETAN